MTDIGGDAGPSRQAAADSVTLAASVGLERGNVVAPLAFAAVFGAISTLVIPWTWSAAWVAAIAAWEMFSIWLSPRLAARHGWRALRGIATHSFTGAVLYAFLPTATLATGAPVGIALGVAWLAGAFVNCVAYYADSRILLASVITPSIVAAIGAPMLAHGPTLASAAISLLTLSTLVAAWSFAQDHRGMVRRLGERQSALADLERKLSVAVEASGDGIYEFNVITGLSKVSDGYAAMLGYGPDEAAMLCEDNLARFIHRDDRAAVSAEFEAHYRGETPHTTSELRMKCKDGSYKWVLSRARLVERTPEGAPRLVVGTTVDISARKALELQLAAARDVAESANAAKSMFVANMSHEIRTPLNGGIGVAGALARTPLTGEQQGMVGLVQSSAHVLDRLLSDVLDQSKLEAGEFELQPAPFDLSGAVQAAAELMRPRAEAKGLAFRVTCEDAARGRFVGDAVRVRQIVSNLAANAVKFTAAGEVRIDVGAGEAGPDGRHAVRIAVIDTGIGFAPAAAERLFARFTQADGSISRQFGGTGLGLAISRALTELMGGVIAASSAPGEGSCFEVTLPLARAAAEDACDDPGDGEDGLDLDGLRVLAAEDHPTNQRVLQLILAPMGVELTLVEDGAAAVEAFRRGAFDLVLMDMQMPVMDGLAATREIRHLELVGGRPRTPVAMLTANAMDEHRRAALAAGADGHIAKPITPQSLIDGMAEALTATPAPATAVAG